MAFIAHEANAAATVRTPNAGRAAMPATRTASGPTASNTEVFRQRQSVAAAARTATPMAAATRSTTQMAPARAATSTSVSAPRASSTARPGVPIHRGGLPVNTSTAGDINFGNIRELIDDLEYRKADRDEVFTKDETDQRIADAIADFDGFDGSDILRRSHVGTAAGQIIAVGADGKIDPSLYDAGSGLPTPPADGNRYVLLASADGSKSWLRVRDTFVKNW